MSVKINFPHKAIWQWPTFTMEPPVCPFTNPLVRKFYDASMSASMPITIALVYFTLVHIANKVVINRQLRQAGLSEKSEARRLRPAPYAVAKTNVFKLLVLLHNAFLCVYSVWTFVGMMRCFSRTIASVQLRRNDDSYLLNFVYAVCDMENGVFKLDAHDHNLTLFGWLFYISKFYEVLDTVIILLKGRPSSLLQSYHHLGAMICMWGGIRYMCPPIWVFVVFNSFIHSLMYFYFTLSCLKFRVPVAVKRLLTSLQISQFIVGGSLAFFHAFVWYTDLLSNAPTSCVRTADQAVALFVNVAYLTPLTMLFASFYIESYLRRK